MRRSNTFSPPKWSTQSFRQRGFTILEIMIALTILATMVSILLSIFSSGIVRAADGESAAKAMIYAQSKMDEILLVDGKALNDIEKSGTIKQTNLSFRIEMKPQAFPSEPRRVALQHVGLTVFWNDGDGEREVYLEALKWVPNEL